MSPDPTAGALLGQVLGKRYLVRRLIGSGGMGAVYEVEHLVTKRIGALKLLHPRYASVPEVVARFVMEASAAGRIDNPHVVQTFDAGELESGEPYMFMELLAGTPMSALMVAPSVRDMPERSCVSAGTSLTSNLSPNLKFTQAGSLRFAPSIMSSPKFVATRARIRSPSSSHGTTNAGPPAPGISTAETTPSIANG